MIAPETIPPLAGVPELLPPQRRKSFNVQKMLGHYPIAVAAVGFLGGILIGWLVKRR